MDQELRRLITTGSIIAARDLPQHARQLAHATAVGELVRLLPGIYVAARLANDLEARMAAAATYHPSAIVVGDAAAALTYWPDLDVPVIDVAGCRSETRAAGYRFTRGSVPHQLVERRWGLRYTIPDLTALDQVDKHGGDGIDRALRSRLATIEGMRKALRLTPRRRGNSDRRVVLVESRDKPWSALERRMHRLLREAGIGGWSTNVPVDALGNRYFVDIVFDKVPLAIELDGHAFHGRDRFDDDRVRGNHLVVTGLRTLHFTWTMVTERPVWVIDMVRRGLQQFGVMAPT